MRLNTSEISLRLDLGQQRVVAVMEHSSTVFLSTRYRFSQPDTKLCFAFVNAFFKNLQLVSAIPKINIVHVFKLLKLKNLPNYGLNNKKKLRAWLRKPVCVNAMC